MFGSFKKLQFWKSDFVYFNSKNYRYIQSEYKAMNLFEYCVLSFNAAL